MWHLISVHEIIRKNIILPLKKVLCMKKNTTIFWLKRGVIRKTLQFAIEKSCLVRKILLFFG